MICIEDNEEDDDDFEEKSETRRGKRERGMPKDEKDRPLPPLLARVNGQIEVNLIFAFSPSSLSLSRQILDLF